MKKHPCHSFFLPWNIHAVLPTWYFYSHSLRLHTISLRLATLWLGVTAWSDS
jgi:hypothetical protein